MSSATKAEPSIESVETRLREDLARGDAMLSSAVPTLRQLLVNDDRTLFSDEIVARVRGMLSDVARQMLHAEAEAARVGDRESFVAKREERLTERLFDDPALLAHVHALTLEAGLALRLQAECNIDPVLSPLVQDLIAAKDEVLAASAMAVLAAQARFIQHYRRMTLPMAELPREMFDRALVALRAQGGGREDIAAAAERALRAGYDENQNRLGLASRLAMRLGTTAPQALDVGQAGVSIFATALAMASGQPRDVTVLSFSERQFVRLALALRAAGLKPPAIDAQFLYLHPDVAVPPRLASLGADRASLLLASSAGQEL